MCGITGFVDFQKNTKENTLQKMTDTLVHRGPDGQGKVMINSTNAQIGFGHRRLSIIDLSEHGKQPMSFQHLTICFNGEVYNYREIKKELVQIGHIFVTDSDTEVILHAFYEWGTDCIHRFIGMFAIAIYDEKKEQITFIRDRAGVKPLFIYHNNDLVLFASELKAFHAHPRFTKKINHNAVAAFLQYGNVPTPHCIFKNCFKVKPGEFIHFSMKDRQMSQHQYWNVYNSYNRPKIDLPYNEAKIQMENILSSAFNYRMVADVPVGIFLSGGYDSVSVASILQKNRTEKIKTFTIGVPDIGLNEAPYAKDIAAHLGTDHTEIECTQAEALELVKDLPYYYDEPFADSSAIPTTLVSMMAKKDVTVALSADAGDEVFAGYNRYDYMLRYRKTLNRIPSIARKSIVSLMNVIPSNSIPILKEKYNFHNRYEKLKQVLNDPSEENIMLSLSQQFTSSQTEKLLTNFISPLDTAYMSKELMDEHKSSLTYMMAIDYQTYLVDDILQKVDRATMTASLEGREPFLDHRIIEFAATLPDNFKYQNGVKKRILRDIVHQYVPQELLDRPKMGFAIPIGDWMMNELKPLVEEYISETRIKKQQILNWSEVNAIKKAFFDGKKEYDNKVWYILMFEMWYEKWMD